MYNRKLSIISVKGTDEIMKPVIPVCENLIHGFILQTLETGKNNLKVNCPVLKPYHKTKCFSTKSNDLRIDVLIVEHIDLVSKKRYDKVVSLYGIRKPDTKDGLIRFNRGGALAG